MSLQSALFRGDPKLEAAAVSDPAHIMKGAKGEHVRKIQQALVLLDKAPITPDGDYGGLTAAAVLAYKQKRKIINFTYQTQADNIVGKMTMAALDKEMVGAEQAPVLLVPVHPQPQFNALPARFMHAKFVPGSPSFQLANVIELPPFTSPNTQVLEIIMEPGQIGKILVRNGQGGKLVRTQDPGFHGRGKNPFQVAKLVGATTQAVKREEVDITAADVTQSYETLNCGETTFQVLVSSSGKSSRVLRVLSLVDKITQLGKPNFGDYSEDPKFKSGLMSKAGTPLKPKEGRKINLFGEGETPDFEDYSSDIDFCSHTFSNGNAPAGKTVGHRPWTEDPRLPPRIKDRSVMNISCRGSPIKPVTIDVIKRIAASGCRVTYAEANGRSQSDELKTGLGGKARVIEEGASSFGFAVILEMN